MKASIRKLEDARQEQGKVKTARSLGRKALLESLRQALAAGRRFDAIMRNTFRNDHITLGACKHACGVLRAPRTKPKGAPHTAEP